MAAAAGALSPFVPVLQEYSLLAEFKLAQKHAIKGVYLQAHPSGAWDGAVFVHSGPYEGGTFKFRVLIPAGYPTEDTPRVFFQTTVFHPQVHPESGELSTARHFAKWRPGRDRLWHLIKLVRHIFYSPNAKAPVFNRAAAEGLSGPAEAFAAQAAQCAADSASESAELEPSNNILQLRRLEIRRFKHLADLMLRWGDGEERCINATLEMFARAAEASPSDPGATDLRAALKASIGSQADTANTVLSASRCKGYLSVPDDAGWQRRWAVLTHSSAADDSGADVAPTTPVRAAHGRAPRTPRADTAKAAGTVLVLYADKDESERVAVLDCHNLCRAYQPNSPEMKSNNTFLIVVPDQVLRMQAPSNNAVQVWLHALTMGG